jgi:hypothetical protein
MGESVLPGGLSESYLAFFEIQFHLRRSTEDGGTPIVELVVPSRDDDSCEAVSDEIHGSAAQAKKGRIKKEELRIEKIGKEPRSPWRTAF